VPVVGRAEVKIVADARGFARDAEREINRELRRIDVDASPIRDGVVRGLTGAAVQRAVSRGGREAGRRWIDSLGIVLQGGISARFAGAIGAVFLGVLGPVMVTVGTLLGGLLISGMGAAIAGLGIFVAAQEPIVQNAFKRMFERIAEQMRDISRPLVGALIVVSRVVEETFEAFAGPLEDAFSDLAPAIAEFAGALGEAFEALAPTIGPITDAFIQILEELGPALANEVFPDLADAIINLANAIGDNADTFVDILTWFLSIPEAIINFLAELTRIAGWFHDNPELIIAALTAIGIVLGALVAGPVGLFIGALIGLGIGLLQFRDQAREIFGNVSDAIFGFVGRAAEKFFEFRNTALRWLSNLGSGAEKIFTRLREVAIEKLRRLGEGVRNVFNSVVTFVRTLPSRIASAASGMWNSIVSGFKSALNAIISGWNNLSFTTPSIDLGPLGSFGGFTIGTPNIPLLQRGGLIQQAGIAEVGEAGRETVFLPAGAVVAPGPAERFIPEAGGLPDEFEATAIIDLGYDIRRVINLIFRRVTSNARAGQGAVA
jgi:hypothetical protein